MPLTPRFAWEEDATSIALQVTLPGAALKNVDIYISDLVIKVNVAPYVLLLDLYDTVDDASAVIKRNATTHVLHITLDKIHAKLWHQLVCEDSKAELKTRRLASMDRRRHAETVLADKRKERKYQDEKQTLRAQMAVDDANRQILSDLKAEEKEREEQAMYESFRELKIQELQQEKKTRTKTKEKKAGAATPIPIATNNQSDHAATKPNKASVKKRVSFAPTDPAATKPTGNQIKREQDDDEVLELNADGTFDIARKTPAETKPIWSITSDELTESDDEMEDIDTDDDDQADAKHATPPLLPPKRVAQETKQEQEPEMVEVVELPAPREAAQTELKFTPRLFPTPMRESKAAEEEDWLLKNRKHLKRHPGLRGAAAAAYDISESDPAWLKAKGDDFYRSRDYRSAVNAYTEAISVAADDSDLTTSCLSNRAACHLQLGVFDKCLDDCSTALSRLPDTPEASATAQSASGDDHARVIREFRLKLKLLVRRGTALCRLGQFTEAKADYGVALTMDKQNPALQYDYYQLLQLEQSQRAKERGDESFKKGALNEAIAHYDESLQLHPQSIACLSNRAACFLRRRELQRCVDDCTSALQLLQQQPVEIGGSGTASEGGVAFFAVGPAPGTAKRREWVVKTLVRRGTAHATMQQLQNAADDYAAAVELDPSNAALQADLGKIQQQLQQTHASETASGKSQCLKQAAAADPIGVAP